MFLQQSHLREILLANITLVHRHTGVHRQMLGVAVLLPKLCPTLETRKPLRVMDFLLVTLQTEKTADLHTAFLASEYRKNK